MISHYRQTEALVVAHAQKRRCRATSLSGRAECEKGSRAQPAMRADIVVTKPPVTLSGFSEAILWVNTDNPVS
ncbi:hypothetical protein J6590_011569 [Homalodisca vitripennis]|nr:hypothetical protein J6590_011569 [Homalodisca vitripennis]